MTILTVFIQLALCQTQHTALGREVTILQAWLLPSLSLFADGGPMVSGNACIQFCQQKLCLQKTCTSLSRSVSAFSSFMRDYLDPVVRLTNVLNTKTTLESQPIMVGTLPGKFGQFSSAFAKQSWNWQSTNAILKSDKWNSEEEQFYQNDSHRKPGKSTIF